ncbi:MAG TPA: FecR family protein [Candidatus Acidoferrales bacterium]|nr:FecR family protein [Candidatus Acidoferrales bacterium]
MTFHRPLIAGILCLAISPWAALCEPQASPQHAGQIDALIPAAKRNDQAAKVKEELDWNDLLKTERSGRVRAGLTDGSILSVGSNSELRVLQHDATSQQTSIEMTFGKVRSQVTKITKPGGKFEMKTPNAVIGVIGTDFYVGFAGNKTTVICYEGQVSVTPTGNVQVARNSGQANSAANSITVAAGQMVEITTVIPPGGFLPTSAPPAVQQGTQLATDVPENGLTPGHPLHAGHLLRNVLIGSGLAAGAAVGAVLATRGGSSCKINPQTGKCG